MNDNLWMAVAKECEKNTTCQRRPVGAAIVKDGKLLSYGVNHTPDKVNPCTSEGCIRIQNNIPSGKMHEICKAVHAEQNAIISANKKGLDLNGSTIYVTASPCTICSKLIINSGISKIVFSANYPDELGLNMLKEAGIKLEFFTGEIKSQKAMAKKIIGSLAERKRFDMEPDEFGNSISNGLIKINDPKNMSETFKRKFNVFYPGLPIHLAIIPGINLMQMQIVQTAFTKCFEDFDLSDEVYVAGIKGVDTYGTNRDVLLRTREVAETIPVANAFLTNSQIERRGTEMSKNVTSHSAVMFSINTSCVEESSMPFEVSSLDNPEQSIINQAHEQSLVRTFRPIVNQFYRH